MKELKQSVAVLKKEQLKYAQSLRLSYSIDLQNNNNQVNTQRGREKGVQRHSPKLKEKRSRKAER
jgi:hypothetical protein